MTSLQQEIPRSRVNITLDVDTGGARKTVELPLKLLVLGDFSNGRASGRIGARERIAVDASNIDAVLAALQPRLRLAVENTFRGDGSTIPVELDLESLASFSPDEVARQIPQVNNLLAMRNLLKDLKSNVLDNARFRRELERIVQHQGDLAAVQGELRQIAPLRQGDEAAPGSVAADASDSQGRED